MDNTIRTLDRSSDPLDQQRAKELIAEICSHPSYHGELYEMGYSSWIIQCSQCLKQWRLPQGFSHVIMLRLTREEEKTLTLGHLLKLLKGTKFEAQPWTKT